MRIDINSKYLISSDTFNFIVIEKSISNGEKTKGEVIEKPIAYCTTLEQCYKHLIDLAAKTSKATNFKDLIEDIKSMKLDIDKSLEIIH